MITKIEVQGFQSLGNITLETGPLTVIYGASDVGKSAFIRALRALYTNRYPKDHVTYFGSKDHSTIAVRFGDTAVFAQKGGGTNNYGLIDGGDAKRFRKVGAGVPPDIAEALGWTANTVASQFDPLYLVAETGSKRAQVLGDLTNFAILIEAVRLGGVWSRRVGQEEKLHRETIEETTQAIESESEKLSEARKKRDQLWGLVAGLGKLEEELETIEEINLKYELVDSLRHEVNSLAAIEVPDLDQIPELLDRLDYLKTFQDRVFRIAQEASGAKHYYTEASEALERGLSGGSEAIL